MPTPARASRRAVLGSLGVAAGVVGLGACDVDDLRPDDAGATVTPSVSTGGPTPDEALVTEVVAALHAAEASVAAARRVRPLRPLLTQLLRTHRRHLAALGSRPGAVVVPVPASAAALSGVRTVEQTLQQQLVGFAVRAQSGTLAALLASMSASVAQHLAVLEPS